MTKQLFYRRGGTLNFSWVKVLEPTADKAADLRRMGYPTIWATEAPSTFSVAA